MRIASHLKMPVQRAQDEITSSEFLEWVAYLDDEPNRMKTEYYYLAQLATIMNNAFAKKPSRIENFILKFTTKRKEKKMSKEQATAISKSKWFAGVGYKG